MKPSNGFNKKQKEEIGKIVKSEIGEALRRNAKTDINIKDEVIEAINSVLSEKDDKLIKNLLEIENEISQEETKKSIFATNIKSFLYVFCILAWTFWMVTLVVTVYTCFNMGNIKDNLNPISVLVLIYILLASILFLFSKSLKNMSKNDLYNSFMFIITMFSFIITIWTVIK